MRIDNRQIAFGVSLTLIVVLMLMSGGCGQPRHEVTNLVFSANDEWLAVGSLSARDACVPGKCYDRDVCRTVELINRIDPALNRIVAQETQFGNCGPVWGDTPLVCYGPAEHSLSMILQPGDGLKSWYLESMAWNEEVTVPANQLVGVAFTNDQRWLATASHEGFKLYDLAGSTGPRHIPGIPFTFHSRAHPFSFSHDGQYLVIADITPFIYHCDSGTKVPLAIDEGMFVAEWNTPRWRTHSQWSLRTAFDCGLRRSYWMARELMRDCRLTTHSTRPASCSRLRVPDLAVVCPESLHIFGD